MKISPTHPRGWFSLVRTSLASALAAILFGGVTVQVAAQSANFDTGTDTGWTHYTLLDYGAAVFSFPPDDAGGSAYKIYAPPTGDDPWGMGNARGGSLRTDVIYQGRFSAAVDLLAWNSAWNQESGMLFYLAEPGLGTTDGYAATYSSGYRNLYITRIVDERDSGTVGVVEGIILDPTHHYRMEVSSHDGVTFVLRFFDKVDLANPWCSVVCMDDSGAYYAGLNALFVWERTYQSQDQGAEATFDNYLASKPADGAMPAVVTDLSPQPGAKVAAFYPTVSVNILDRDTLVDTATIKLAMDGAWIPSESLTIETLVHKLDNPGVRDFSGATVTYPITTTLAWGSRHTNQVVFADTSSHWYTNTWVWTSAYPYLPASNSLPVGSLQVRGFDTRMVQSANGGTNLDNTLARALQQLARPPSIPIDLTATSLVQTLSWDKTSTSASVPGLCPGNYVNIAVESFAYLQLTPGLHRFHIMSDDRAGLYSSVNWTDTDPLVLWQNPGNTADATFDFVVEAAGLYPVRCIWEETGGGANLSLYSVNLDDLTETLINDPSDTTDVVKAWYPLVCLSASSVTGPFTAAVAAVNSLNTTGIVGTDCSPDLVGQMVTGGTFTLPVTGATQFYCVQGARQTKITNFTKDNTKVVITYQVQ